MRWPSEAAPEVIGLDVLDELTGPHALWVPDGSPALLRRVLGRRRIRLVRPGSEVPRRSGPPVALLVDRVDLARKHLAALQPLPTVPVSIRGGAGERPEVRLGRVLRPGPEEPSHDFTARVAAAAERLSAEQRTGWWALTRGVAVPPAPRAGWRRRWDRSAPVRQPRRRAIWS